MFKDRTIVGTKFKDLEEYKDQDALEVYKHIDLLFKRFILVLRISLKNIDDLIENVDDMMQYDNLQQGWIIREIMMAHRFRIHEQLDLLLKQSSKLEMLKRMHLFL